MKEMNMRKTKILLIVIAIMLVSCSLKNGDVQNNLSKKEIAIIHADIKSMTNAINKGNIAFLYSRTHHSIFEMIGGKKNLKELINRAMAKIKENNIKYIASELFAPKNIYIAGDEKVCFVPRISIMETQGIKVKSTGYMVAILKKGSSEWKYLDGAGFRKDQSLLWKLLPKLPRDIILPPNFVEVQ